MPLDQSPLLGRRSALLVGASALLLSASGCGEEQPDPKIGRQLASLRDQAQRARRESSQAGLLAQRDPAHAEGLREAQGVRRAHAEALDAQVRRFAPREPTTSARPPGAPDPSSLAEFTAALAESRSLAADFARDASGRQAGLAASVAAAIGALLMVVLVEEPR